MTDQSKLLTDIDLDDPLVLDSRFRVNNDYVRATDNKILAAQFFLKTGLLDGTISSWYTIDPSPSGVDILVGQCVCAVARSDDLIVITPATADALAAAGACLGIAMMSGVKGQKIRVATGGIVAASVTGFGSGSAQPVRVGVNTYPERVVSLGGSDFGVGIADTVGNITLIRGGVSGAGGSIIHGSAKQLFFTDITGTTTQWLTAAQDLTVAISGSNANFSVVGITGAAGSVALFGVSSLSWATGTAAPTATVADGSLYTRTGGSNGDLYLRRAGAWVDIGAAATGNFGSQAISTTGTLSAGATTLSSLALTTPLPISSGGTGLASAPSAGVVISNGSAFSSVTGTTGQVPFWNSNTLAGSAGLAWNNGTSTLSVTNVTVGTALTLSALTNGLLQVDGSGNVSVAPGSANANQFMIVDTVPQAEALPVASFSDMAFLGVRELHRLFELVTATRTADHLSVLSTPTAGRYWQEWA